MMQKIGLMVVMVGGLANLANAQNVYSLNYGPVVVAPVNSYGTIVASNGVVINYVAPPAPLVVAPVVGPVMIPIVQQVPVLVPIPVVVNHWNWWRWHNIR